jgi:dienelactone hydrolase
MAASRVHRGCSPIVRRSADWNSTSGGEWTARIIAARWVAIRGSDRGDLGDWISNFRWLNRLVPKFDQYAQVQDHITQVVIRVKRGCGGGTQFVSVGHSLGGGLAKQAAYADAGGSIKYFYGFDPSPVTGFFDVSEMVRKRSTAGLGVDRAYEEGEILSLPRAIIENIFPPADCHPRIRSVRFHVLTGLPGAQHSIEDLTKQLRIAASMTPEGAGLHGFADDGAAGLIL